MPFCMIKFLQLQIMERDEPRKKDHEDKVKQAENSGSSSGDSYVSEGYESSFIASEDEEEDDYGPRAYRDNPSDEDSREHKTKKDKKKDKKKSKKSRKEKKERRMKEDDDILEDDYDVIDNDDNRLTRLKKKKVIRESEEEFDYPNNEYQDQMSEHDDEDGDVQSDVQHIRGQFDEEDEEYSKMNEVIEKNMDIFDPFQLKNMSMADEDRDLVDMDLPQRYLYLLRNNMRGQKKKLSQVIEAFEKDDLGIEANWIFHRMKIQGYLESFDETDCKERIRRVLECLHRDHLEIMYVYYYRKKIYSDYLNLDNLWKIVEFDAQWHLFRERQKKILGFLQTFLPSYMDVPVELNDMINNTYEPKFLKYFEDFQKFMAAKWTSNTQVIKTENLFGEDRDKKSERAKKGKMRIKPKNKLEFIGQMVERGVIEELEQGQIFLTPQNLCFNLTRRNQEKKPRSPQLKPKEEFDRILGSSNPETDKDRFPLLVGESRFKTISKYLSFELYCYPELRKILREKYYKKLVISTSPTARGNQDIDIYSIYFPVKRIKQKPISTLKRDIWMLAREAEKLGHIKMDLKFQWEITSTERSAGDRDQVYLEIIKNYYDFVPNENSEVWNLFRKRVISSLLNDYIIPSFMKEIKDELTREGQKQIINACCAKFRAQLNKSPSLKEGKPIKILSLVLEDTKLGVAFVDESGKAIHSFHTAIANDIMLKDFVSSQNLKDNIREYKPDMILIAANCKKAQTLRKELRTPDLFPQTIFCAFGEYEVPRLIAKKKLTEGHIDEESIIEAISMARLKKNPMAEIISLWNEKLSKNGILSMNLHPYQRFVNQVALRNSLENVIIEIVNLVGLDINDIKKNQHVQSQIQFVSGLGPRKAQLLLDKLKDQGTEIINRRKIEDMVRGEIVAKNCAPFFKVESIFHKALFEKIEKQKKGHTIAQYEQINMLDMTRIPEEWHELIFKKLNQSYKSTLVPEMRGKKQFSKLRDENIFILQLFKNPEKIRSIDWKIKESLYYDEELVKTEIVGRFRNTRDPERVMENKQIFFNLLKETPDTLKRYTIMSVKVLSVKKNYLNVIITENGLFGYIKLPSSKTSEEYQKIYEKGSIIKAILIGFPFDQKSYRDQQPTEEQELLKVEMALDFPHKENADRHESMRHDCLTLCFPSIVKSIHPNIDLQKDRFEIKKEDKPVIENREDKDKEKIVLKNLKPDFRRISHPKFRNISAQPAIELMKSENNGQFIIRPSSQGPEYLVITWKFFGKVIVHIKIRCEHKGIGTMNMTYRIQDKDNRSYNSLQEIIEKCIKPMNMYVQDVTSSRKFLDRNIEEVENTIKRDMSVDSSHIYYYFGVSEEFPQFFLLIYMYRDKKPIRELIKVKNSGLYFHDQQFSNARDLIAWFKEHLKEKEYQKYAKNMAIQMQKMK